LNNSNFSKIVVAPEHYLLGFPFSAISFLNGTLGDKYEIIQMPNISTFFYLNKRCHEIHLQQGNSLIYGNPTGDLEYSEKEAESLAKLLNAKLYLGSNCNKEVLFSQTKDSPIVHLACHGYFDSDFAQLSGILIADGITVTASELSKLELNNPLVVLSACESGRMASIAGSELVSLFINLFEAGASSIIVSLWKVDDRSTMLLMKKFYEYWIEGYPLSRSLRYAQLWLKEQYTEYSHPYFWAPFIIIGSDLRLKV
jgi:CHAT domain-containing protein